MTPSVAVLGGGIGGLSAAHELVERGFDVTVYEASERLGGKARSIPIDRSEGAILGEHGFRFFPGFYRHVVDTMERIPYRDRSVADNLVPTSQSLLARATGEEVITPTTTPRTIGEWRAALQPPTAQGLSGRESAVLAERMVALLTSCEARREEDLEHRSWWEFVDADRLSASYRRLAAATQLLVALRPQDGSARTIGRIYVQLIRGQLDPRMDAERVLNGPTSTVWIEPWVDYLEDRGVEFVRESPVMRINCDRRRVTCVETARGEVCADYYVAAVPVEAMVDLLTPELRRGAPSLAHLDRLETGWMSGIQFYLGTDRPLVHGHQLYLDSPWALTAISQRQFWSEYNLPAAGDGDVEGVLSVIISDWDTPGERYDKPARECTPEEIKAETWAQLASHLNRGERRLADDDLVDWFLNPAIEETGEGLENREPLLVNTAGSLRYRPEAGTELGNLVVAADYVRTETDLASMEGANEAARRAVNAILDRSGVDVPRCELWELREPAVFEPLRAHDAIRYRLGLPHASEGACSPIRDALVP